MERLPLLRRRTLLKHGTGVMASMATCSLFPNSLGSETSPGSTQVERAHSVVSRPALSDVHLLEGVFAERAARNRTYLLSLDPDRFLHYFRLTAGLAPKSEPYPGWEEKVGRMLGHYLSACSMYAAATQEASFRQRQQYAVGELAACQRANGNGYVGGVGDARRIFTEISQGNIYFVKGQLNGVHAPWYMLHKMAAGLRDAYVYAGNSEALTTLVGFSDWAVALTSKLSDAQMQTMLQDEHGGMNEIFADVYAYTGKDKYLLLSRRFNRRSVLGPLMQETDNLDGLHANTQIPTVLGLYRQYEVSGDGAAKRGAMFFWHNVTRKRSYVNGGDSEGERFYPIGEMGAKLSAVTAETCNSYNMVKLTDRLFAGGPREEFAAYNERVLWNHILASQDPRSTGLTYFLSLRPGHFKTFSEPYESFWCCVGTGMENHAKYGESLYSYSAEELWINQFVASEFHWKDKGLRIVQTTNFPLEPRSEWRITCGRPVRAAVRLRRPQWAGEGFQLAVNGHSVETARPGSYHSIARTWHSGDVITADLPLRLRLEPMGDDPSWAAVLYGPVVLAGLMDDQQLPTGAPYAGNNQLQYVKEADPTVPMLGRQGAEIDGWMRQTGLLKFSGDCSSRKVSFVPLYSVGKERYSVYWKVAPSSV